MVEKQFISDESIINCLKNDYSIEVVNLNFLPLGADMNASVYKAIAHDRSYFVKLKRGQCDNSVAIVELLHKAEIQVIPPYKTIDGKLTQKIRDFTLIVYPFVEGQDGFNRHLTDEQWLILGKNLRKLHEINVPPSIKNMIAEESYSPKWRDLVRSFYIQNSDKMVQDEIALKLLNFLKKDMPTILRLVDRAETLATKVQVQLPEFVLCHSDIHGGNVLINQNDIVYIVDWDDPIMAPKERDLMFIGGGVANVWNKPYEEQLFYKGYGETEINKSLLAYYRHERIVEDIALYVQALLFSSAGGEERSVMYKQFIDMFKPNGVVDIAFNTDEIL